MQRTRQSRRTFLAQGAAAASATLLAGTAAGQRRAPSTGRVLGANDRITVAFIGTGSQGFTHVRNAKANAAENNIVPAAVCDVYQKRLDRAKAHLALTDRDAVRDYRRIIDRKDIDAVVIS